MKKIKIFLASSIGELRMERLAVSELVGELNDDLIDDGIRIQLFMCEHHDTAIAAQGKQKEYNHFIMQPCDIFLNLYYRKAGEYTMEEFDVALETFRTHKIPRIFVLLKEEAEMDGKTDQLEKFITKAEACKEVTVLRFYKTKDLTCHVKDIIMQTISLS